MNDETPERRRVRTWIPIALLSLSGLALAGVWSRELMRQNQVLASAGIGLFTGALLLLWLAFEAGFSGRARRRVLAVVLFVGVAAAALVEVRGVSGDFVPILSWRFGADRPGDLERPTDRAVVSPAATTAEITWRDFPQFRGAERDGVVRGVALATDWTARPPREVWRRAVGAGWSGFAVAGRTAVTQEQRGEEELVVAYDLLTGAVLWSHAERARHDTTLGGLGPRATPAIAGGRVFALGATGLLTCLDAATGEQRWTRDAVQENGARVEDWGVACSPLVDAGRVIVSIGGSNGRSLVAYDAATGAPAWAGGSGRAAYASPRRVTLAGVPQLVIVRQDSIAGHDPDTGAELWRTPFSPRSPNVADVVPVSATDFVVSSGYGHGSERYTLSADDDSEPIVARVWSSRALKSKFANFVLHEGSLFGFDDGVLTCIDAETGARRWKEGRTGHGQLLLVGDALLISAESGEVWLVAADPAALRELGRFEALASKTWNTHALAAPYLLVRNDQEAVCFELALEKPAAQ